MAVLDARKTYKNLKKKGFVDSPNKSDDHLYIEFYHKKKLVLYTKISHGSKDLGDFLIKQMSSQCNLDKKGFMDLANCPMSASEYLKHLEKEGYLE